MYVSNISMYLFGSQDKSLFYSVNEDRDNFAVDACVDALFKSSEEKDQVTVWFCHLLKGNPLTCFSKTHSKELKKPQLVRLTKASELYVGFPIYLSRLVLTLLRQKLSKISPLQFVGNSNLNTRCLQSSLIS
jgi:hypothetical protein